VLTGEGADELLGGYSFFRIDRLLRPLAHLPLVLRRPLLLGGLVSGRWPRASRILLAAPRMDLARYRSMIAPFPTDVRAQLFSADIQRALRAADEPERALPVPDGFERWHPFAQLQYYELKVRLPDYMVHHVDRASMAYSLEARVPFLDHELVELCSHIPPALKMRRLREKHILRRAMREHLPRQILQRKKRGLAAPLAPWLRAPLPEFAAALLSTGCLKDKGYFDPEAVTGLLDQHKAGQADHGHQLLGVLTVQLWDELLLKGCRQPSAGT
jgi:asparagine synthase (glutamine-hydrolysing)